ncbi:MAG: hypothetical protein SFU86_22780 [Pirellulaceae bacterium]|nr:hypothetical protein [Pirellulaceae bacterium]
MTDSDGNPIRASGERPAGSSPMATREGDNWFNETPAHSTASYEAFLLDLPELMETHPGLCAAYQNGVRMGIGPRRREFYQELFGKGCDPTRLLVFTIEPQVPLEVEVSWLPDDEIEVEQHADDR